MSPDRSRPNVYVFLRSGVAMAAKAPAAIAVASAVAASGAGDAMVRSGLRSVTAAGQARAQGAVLAAISSARRK